MAFYNPNQKLKKWLIHHHKFVICSLIFIIIYCLISLINHYNFRTNAFDLGIFNQTVYHYAHGQIKPNTIRGVDNLLGDHFEFMLIFISPLYWIFKSYTLLVFQILMFFFGSLGIYLFIKLKTRNIKLAFLASLLFYLFFGVYDALSFDYHNNAAGIMLLPWLLYFFASKRLKLYFLILVVFLLFKENLSLIAMFLGAGLFLFQPKRYKWVGFVTLVASLLYFILIIGLVIPNLNQNQHYYYLSPYQNQIWPQTFSAKELIKFILNFLIQLFNHPVKLRMWILFIFTGGLFVFFNKRLLLLLVPVLIQKFYSDQPNYWGHQFQYSVELAVIVPTSAVLFIYHYLYRYKILARSLAVFLIFSNCFILSRIHFYDQRQINLLFRSNHYQRPIQRSVLIQALSLIPEHASVSAQNTLVPHLANREQIYLLPQINQASFIIINLNDERVWPLVSQDDLVQLKNNLVNQNQYQTIFSQNQVYVFSRN
ncbi:MAG: DUF2079 domain-containing protein [Candidatus Moranbacteria bacterium]|nr:DUF2079 domain-containing protein [Candidatus Moranbacteria bacterium]